MSECVSITPVLEGRDRRTPGAHWPAGLAELASVSFSERHCPPQKNKGVRAGKIAQWVEVLAAQAQWLEFDPHTGRIEPTPQHCSQVFTHTPCT